MIRQLAARVCDVRIVATEVTFTITVPRGLGAPADTLGGNAGLPRTLNRPKDELLEATLARLVKTKKGGKNKKRPPAAGAATMDGATAGDHENHCCGSTLKGALTLNAVETFRVA